MPVLVGQGIASSESAIASVRIIVKGFMSSVLHVPRKMQARDRRGPTSVNPSILTAIANREKGTLFSSC